MTITHVVDLPFLAALTTSSMISTVCGLAICTCMLQMREGMLQALKIMKVKFNNGEFANLPVVLPTGNLTVNYIHAGTPCCMLHAIIYMYVSCSP